MLSGEVASLSTNEFSSPAPSNFYYVVLWTSWFLSKGFYACWQIVGLSLNGKCAFGFQNYEEPHDHKVGSPQPLSSTFDHRVESLKLEDEIDQILHALRKSQDFEYRLAEERLFAHKNYILNLYQQLDKERSELSRHASLKDPNTTVLDAVQSRIEQIKREVSKLKDMEEAKKGFGRVSKYILKEHFGLEIESWQTALSKFHCSHFEVSLPMLIIWQKYFSRKYMLNLHFLGYFLLFFELNQNNFPVQSFEIWAYSSVLDCMYKSRYKHTFPLFFWNQAINT